MKQLDSLKTRDILLIFVLVLVLVGSFYFQQVNFSLPLGGDDGYNEPQTNTTVNESQGGYVPDTSTEIGICEKACIDFCQTHPNTPFIPWREITPQGSTKNCKTIIEEELGLADLSQCEQCKCVCFSG